MTQRKILWIIPLLALAMVGAGCGKTTAEKTVENNIKKATNGQADVDLTNNSAKVNINGSSLVTGDRVSLPSDWPTDVYVADGTIKTAVSTKDVGWTVSLESTQSVSVIQALYAEKLPTAGWIISANATVEKSVAIIANKNTRSLNIGISDVDGKTVVTITVSLPTNTNTVLPQ